MQRLTRALDELASFHGEPAADEDDPWRAIVGENVAYLVDDDTRRAALAHLEATVTLDPAAMLEANPSAIRAAVALGGAINIEGRVEKLRQCATIVVRECGGDLAGAIASWPLTKVRKLLKTFPGVGDPGAARMLLFSGRDSEPALESNGVRTLTRLGYLSEDEQYAAWNRNAVAVLAVQGRPQAAWRRRAFLLLRKHGREVCKRKAPACDRCPLRRDCRYARVAAAAEGAAPRRDRGYSAR